MRIRWVLSAVVVLTLAAQASCSDPPGRRERSAEPVRTTSPPTPSLPTSAPPALPDDPTGGVRIGFAQPAWYTDEYDLPVVDVALREIRETGAGWLVLTPTWYQDDVRRGLPRFDRQKTVSDAGVRRAIDVAQAEGLRVVLKPHVDRDDDGDRAEITPTDRRRWFAAYRDLVTHYAAIAAEAGVDEFVVGTELAGTTGDEAAWRVLIGAVRSKYPGPLTYAANYDEFEDITFWDALDAIGIDAYFPLAARPTTDPEVLARAWTPIVARLEALAAETGKPILFTEAGYPSQVGAAVAPYDWERSKIASNAEQAAGYEALFAALAGKSWFLGVYWWMWDDLLGRTEDDQAVDYTPHGKPAEAVVRRQAEA